MGLPIHCTDATARVGGLVAIVGVPLGAQVGAPGLVAETDCARQPLANLIRAAQPAQVGGLLPVLVTKKLMAGLAWAPSAPMLWVLSLLMTPTAAIAARRKICCFISFSFRRNLPRLESRGVSLPVKERLQEPYQ
jgi:hypothetical protein